MDNRINFLDNDVEFAKPGETPKKVYRVSDLFYLFFAVWCVDFATTILALNLSRFDGMFYEVNPLSSWFFSFGVIGWMGAFLFSFTTLLVISFLIIKLINSMKSEDAKFSLWIGAIVMFLIFEGNVIFNNIMLMTGTRI